MSVFVLKNSKIYLGGYDVSGDLNKATMGYKAEEKDITTFGQSAKKRICGLSDTDLKLNGFWQADSSSYKVEDILWSKFAISDEVITIFPQTGAAGELGYSFKAMEGEYSPGGQVGDVLGFDMSAMANDLLVRATCMESGAKTSTAAGTGRQLGAVLATQKVYAGIHILAKSGTLPTLDIKIQSDDNASFTSATDRITLTQMNAIGAQWATPLAGAITDDYWRFYFTVGGSGGPSFTVRAWIGIQ